MKLVSTKLALAALVGAALSMLTPATAQAGPLSATVVLSSHLFPTGGAVPGGLSGVLRVSGGSSVKLTTPEYIYRPAVAPATSGTVYEFMFWDVYHTLIGTDTALFTAPSAGHRFLATAWYTPICVVESSCSGGTPSVTTWAFSLTSYKVLPGTPISSVTPASAWTYPSTSVSTATAVDITASSYLGAHSKSSGTEFSAWFVLGAPSAVTISADLDVPAGESPYAIAFYYQYTGPGPVICLDPPRCI